MFERTIRAYCNQIGWTISEINKGRAILKFDGDSEYIQTVYIIDYNGIIEFSVPSMLLFSSYDEIPHQLSTILLCLNSKYRIGEWCIENISDKLVFSIMYNCGFESLDRQSFEDIVTNLVGVCDKFEQSIQSTTGKNVRSGTVDWVRAIEVTGNVIETITNLLDLRNMIFGRDDG